ncbi:MAG: sugar ABC transporter permease [Actinobacteria bacterium]|nr:sugar ABC transporter permease [Actinomycetota bacterium]
MPTELVKQKGRDFRQSTKRFSFLSERYTPYWLVLLAIITIAAILIYPLMYSLYLSFMDMNLGRGTNFFVGFENYSYALFEDPVFHKVLGNNMVFMVFSLTLELLLGFAIALLLNHPFRGRKYVRVLFLLPMLAAPVLVGTNFRWIFNEQFGLLNAILRVFNLQGVAWLVKSPWPMASIIVAEVWQYTPFTTLLFLAGLQSLPDTPFEAAKIDGASWWQQLRYITIPLLVPIISITAILRIIDIFRVFDIVYVMTLGGPARATDLLPTYTYEVAFSQARFGYASAISWITLLISLVFLIPFIKSVLARSFE